MLSRGATFDNGGSSIKYQTVDEFEAAKLNGVNINVEEGYQNLNRWTSDGTVIHNSINDFNWDGTGSLIIRNNISTTVSFKVDAQKGTIASPKVVFNDEEGALFDTSDFSVTGTLRWVFTGYKKNDESALIQAADITWANSYNPDSPVVYNAEFTAKAINTVEILTPPNKHTYIEGDNFDISGLVIKVTYADGQTETVEYNNSSDDFDVLTGTLSLGMNAARVKFLAKEFTVPITVNKKKAVNISINTMPNKLTYSVGDALNVSGLIINATYNNGTTGTIAYAGNESLFSFNPGLTEFLLTSMKNVEVTYDGCKASFEITVTGGSPSPSPSGGGGSSRGGDVANLNVGPLANSIHTLRLSETKAIKGVLNSDLGAWKYDPINDKWKFSASNEVGLSVDAAGGFYMLTKVNQQMINGVALNTVSNNTYYFDANGNMVTGYIVTADNKTYYFETLKTNSEGMMIIGWKEILGSWYYFGSDGAMLANAYTPDGYLVGMDGKWIQ